jgi:hypothetical protein
MGESLSKIGPSQVAGWNPFGSENTNEPNLEEGYRG